MRRNKTKKLAVTSLLAVLAFLLLGTSLISNVHALTFPRSSKVAMVPSPTSSNGGTLYTGPNWPDSPSFTFSNLSPTDIANGAISDPIVAGGYDTVVLMTPNFNFASYWADADFSSRILDFVNGGGKLIIYTSESTSATAFASFVYPFTVDTPGQTGSLSGTIVNIADDTLSSNNIADPSYINLALVTSQTDAVGDLTVMTSVDSHWYIDMTGINVRNVGGPAHTYAFYGAGLIIFNGLDVDYATSGLPTNTATGYDQLQRIWWRELCGQVLGPGQSVSGLTLTPATATNVVGSTHTVTALVKDTINNPVPDVLVTFTITSGPSAGTSGTATTDENGEATFSWSSAVPGTDTVQASINNAAGALITTTATKDWVPGNVIPEGPFGTIALSAAMLVGIGLFFGRNKILKAIKP
jgi:hypothetical protein